MACERRDGDSRASDRIWRTSRSNHADHDDVYVDDYDDDYDDEEGAATAARWVSAVVLLYSVGFVVCARHYSPRLASPRLDSDGATFTVLVYYCTALYRTVLYSTVDVQ